MKGRWIALALSAALALGSGCTGREEPFDLDAGRIETDTRYLCQEIGIRPPGSPEETAACDWLEGELEGMGFSYGADTLRRTQFAGLDGLPGENITARWGTGEGPWVALVAHFDSVPTSVGAGDNAASVSVLLEIARWMSAREHDWPGRVELVFLGAEENGYHGSRAYAQALSPRAREDLVAVYNMDISASYRDGAVLVCNTLGGRTGADGYGEGDFLEPAENMVSRTVAAAYEELYGDGYGGTYHMGESDQVSFHQVEVDAANVCWRRLDSGGLPILPEQYHRAEDAPDALDYDTARTTGRCILRAAQLALGMA